MLSRSALREWSHVGVRTPYLAAELTHLGVTPDVAGVIAPNRHTYGTNVEAGLIAPAALAHLLTNLWHLPARSGPKHNARQRDTATLDLFAARAPSATVGRATAALERPAEVRPWLPPQFPPGAPLIVSYGGGVDSTGVLVGFVRHGIRPDLILFADTGGEHPETYLYLDVMDAYLAQHGFPRITRVKNVPKGTEYRTLEENCVSKAMLPSLAYGSHKHSCSLKWKIAPMDAWIRKHFAPVASAVKAKRRVDAVRVIGYDAGPADMRRQAKLEAETHDRNVNWHYWYPLQEWEWDRERTISEIVSAGLPPPPKSSCFFCPSQKPWELIELAINSPELAWRVIAMEHAAGPNLDTLDGLWRAPVRGGTGDVVGRPGSMTEFLLEWMHDGRAYAALPSLSAPGVSATELASSRVIGAVYRRRLPVAGQDLSLDRAALADLARRGTIASEHLRARYVATFGQYTRAESLAVLAGAVSGAIARLTTARRALARENTRERREGVAEAQRRYDEALVAYNASRQTRGASVGALARGAAMFARTEQKAAIRATIRAAAAARRRGSGHELDAAAREYAALRESYANLLRSQNPERSAEATMRAVGKVLAKFDRQFTTGKASADADDEDEDDEE